MKNKHTKRNKKTKVKSRKIARGKKVKPEELNEIASLLEKKLSIHEPGIVNKILTELPEYKKAVKLKEYQEWYKKQNEKKANECLARLEKYEKRKKEIKKELDNLKKQAPKYKTRRSIKEKGNFDIPIENLERELKRIEFDISDNKIMLKDAKSNKNLNVPLTTWNPFPALAPRTGRI